MIAAGEVQEVVFTSTLKIAHPRPKPRRIVRAGTPEPRTPPAVPACLPPDTPRPLAVTRALSLAATDSPLSRHSRRLVSRVADSPKRVMIDGMAVSDENAGAVRRGTRVRRQALW
ncbi:hypothetical protein BDZ89DRAFT_1058803 [Hymenopellis radicata]|nr:hypothetical protein BDZ89DRAFT_1058803 [Hymenopellis radicata]